MFTSINRPVSSGSATSEPFLPDAVGTYYWKAVYSGDSNNNGVSGACGVGVSGETLTVNKAPTSTTTAVHDVNHNVVASVPLNSVVHDSASVGTQVGSLVIGGQVTYNFYTGSACSGTPTWTDTVPVGSESKATDVLAAGEYRFQAVYLGDNNYSGSTSSCETLTVGKAAPTLSTVLSADQVPVLTSVTDTATLSGGVNPTGKITFYVYPAGDAACSLSPIETFTVDVNGNSGYTSPTFTPSSVGVYQWVAAYGGDDNNKPASSNCGEESLEVEARLGIVQTTLSSQR